MDATQGAESGLPAEEVRGRFAWARRQGLPAWLWPDVPVDAWRSAMQGIAGAAAAMLAGEVSASIDGEAQSIGLTAYTSGMGPLLGLWLEQGRLRAGDSVAATLARHLAHNRLRAGRMAAAAAEIVDRLAERGIDALVLKGAHTGHAYFPEPGARPASDIDLLVAESDAPGAEAAMEASGLSLKSRNRWESCWVAPSARREPRTLN